jgi:hypothetical protein
MSAITVPRDSYFMVHGTLHMPSRRSWTNRNTFQWHSRMPKVTLHTSPFDVKSSNVFVTLCHWAGVSDILRGRDVGINHVLCCLTTFLQNAGNYSPNDRASHPNRLKSVSCVPQDFLHFISENFLADSLLGEFFRFLGYFAA